MKKVITVLAVSAFFAACSPNGSDNAVSNDSFVTHDTGQAIEGTGGGSTGNSESNALSDSSTKMSDSNSVTGNSLREDSAKSPH